MLARAVYGPYVWLTLAAAVIPTLALLLVTPTLAARRHVAHWGARVFFVLIGSPIRVEGAGNLSDEPCVVVANHASYLDGIILKAALPPQFTFLIKAEMTSVPLAGFILKRIGSAFVKRGETSHRLRTGRRLLKGAMQGESLAFFPEGTFDGTPGLKPFRPGAFAAAWRGRVACRTHCDQRFPAHVACESLAVRARANIHYDMRTRRFRCARIGL